MEPTTSEVILAELRELRQDYSAHARQTGERLAALEQSMHQLAGNSQPGRIGVLEAAVAQLQRFRWRLLGAIGAASAISSGVAWLWAAVIRR